MAFISFNGDFSIAQPSDVKEQFVHKVVDRISVKGVTHRYWEAAKKNVTLTFSALTQAQYAVIIGYVENQGVAVTYNNTGSGFSFTGFATKDVTSYYRGTLFLRDMTVTIVER